MEQEADQIMDPPMELNPVEEIVRCRCLFQLDFAKHNPLLRKRIESVFPQFFEQDFQVMPLQELLKRRRSMFNSFSIDQIHNSTKNQYNLIGIACKVFAKNVIGYDDDLGLVDNLFNENIALHTLLSLGKIKPNQPFTFSPMESIINTLMPAANLLYSMKESQEVRNQLKEIGDSALDPNEVIVWQDVLQ